MFGVKVPAYLSGWSEDFWNW